MNTVIPLKKKRAPKVDTPASESTPDAESRELNRVPWSGNLSRDEMARPGGLLLAALVAHCNESRQTLSQMAVELGITYGYINQLRNGHRNIDQISDDFANACARYLGVPLLSVLMLSGRIKPEHVYESEALLAAEIPRAMRFICSDPDWGPLATAQIRALDPASHFMVIRLYEEATKKTLLPARLDLKALAKGIEDAQKLQARRATEVAAFHEGNRRPADAAV